MGENIIVTVAGVKKVQSNMRDKDGSTPEVTLTRKSPQASNTRHPYLNLNMGIVKMYTMEVLRFQTKHWLEKGWVRGPRYVGWASPFVVHLMNRPRTLSEAGPARLIGVCVMDVELYLGSYGMGGPGFIGLLLEPEAGERYSDYLTYTVWGSSLYTLLDGRVIRCSDRYTSRYNPWLPRLDADADHYKQAYELLRKTLRGTAIESVKLDNLRCVLTLTNQDETHQLEFLADDPRLPPADNGKPRTSKIDTCIGDYLVFQNERATLWV